MTFTRGDRVNTPSGPGTVNYIRMLPPDYTAIGVVSVALDRRFDDLMAGKYFGTIFTPEKLAKLDGAS